MPSATPADVLARRRQLILNGDIDGFADLFALDGVIEAPFAPPGAPSRLEGREAIREYSRHLMASPLRLDDFEVTELYQTQDPEVVIVELRTNATITTTGRRSLQRRSRFSASGKARSCSSATSPIPGSWRTCSGTACRIADMDPGR